MSGRFESLTVVLPNLNETTSLEHTIECLVGDLRQDLAEILVIACERTTPQALATAEEAVARHPDVVHVH